MKLPANLTPDTLATEFIALLNASLSPEEAAAIVERNAKEESPEVCHSHDFLDANQILIDALKALGCDTENEGFDFNDDSLMSLTNSAWDIAKSRFAVALHGSKWASFNIPADIATVAAQYPNLQPQHTGGNCDYITRDLPNGMRLALTGSDDCPEPRNLEEPCAVVLIYNLEEVEGIEFSFPSAILALQFMGSAKPF